MGFWLGNPQRTAGMGLLGSPGSWGWGGSGRIGSLRMAQAGSLRGCSLPGEALTGGGGGSQVLRGPGPSDILGASKLGSLF